MSVTQLHRRALFERAPGLRDLVPFTPLADGLPVPVERVGEQFWIQRDDRSDSRYGGNKVRKLEHLLPIAVRRGGPVLTSGAVGSHHVYATAIHAARLGLEVEAVRFPQPDTPHVRHMDEAVRGLDNLSWTSAPSSTTMPLVLARRYAALLPRKVTLVTPGGSTPLGVLGEVGAGIELVEAFEHAGWDEPDDVVVALGSGGSSVGIALGIALAGWRRAQVVAVRVADVVVTNRPVLTGIEAGVRALLAAGGVTVPAVRLSIDGAWFGKGYGHPTDAGADATRRAAAMGVGVEATYTAKALAAALHRADTGRAVVYVHTWNG